MCSQGNATVDVCVYIHIHALCGYAISIYGVASVLLTHYTGHART